LIFGSGVGKLPEKQVSVRVIGLKVLPVDEILHPEGLLFPAVNNVVVTAVEADGEAVRVAVCSAESGAECPVCGGWSTRVHSSYLRFPSDLPTAGRPVRLSLRVRRFFCRATSCPRRTFVEQIPGLTRRHGQRTERQRKTVGSLGLALAGRAGARLARRIGVGISRSTVLRVVASLPLPHTASPRVVGVDEFALRKGMVYGTVLVDGETRRPLDLLPDREAGTVAAWLAQRPGVEVVCRDRATFYADGVTAGAPQATQVADRWHVWHNLAEAAERCVSRHRACLKAQATRIVTAPEPVSAIATDPANPWRGHRFADRTRETHATVHALLATGRSQRAVARELGMGRHTVRRYAAAPTPEAMFRGQWQNRTSKLDDYLPYLNQRWEDGCRNVRLLYDEIRAHGFTGKYGIVRNHFQPHRKTPRPPVAKPPSTRQVTGWIMRHPDALTEDERLHLKAARSHCPDLDALTQHVRSFATMLTQLRGNELPQWITDVRGDNLPELHRFATGLERDNAAVTAGLTLPWNSGMVEGHVNRIKMLKRQMYGRAGFALLRTRVLLA
jgi:transposase